MPVVPRAARQSDNMPRGRVFRAPCPMTEVELKFAIDAGARERIARSPALAGAKPVRKRVVTQYFDTPDELLRRRGMALRLRRLGSRWIQSLKGGGEVRGGLHARGEWEFERPDASIDLSLFAATPLARLPGARELHRRLRPAFTVDMVRTAWIVSPVPGARLEVALDVGEARAAAGSEPISELEIECLEGGVEAAFDLAARLLESAPMRLSAVSKAMRGYRAFRAEPLRPAKARPVALDPAMTLDEAARAIVAGGLAHFQANEEGVLHSGDPEFVHQARVALRRLRAELRLLREPAGRRRARAWREALRPLSAALGRVRDRDVFAATSLPGALAAFGDAALATRLGALVDKQRRRERRGAARALESPRAARTMLSISRWLATPGDVAAARPQPLPDFAVRAIRDRHARVVSRTRRIGKLGPAARHRLRIEVKRLRYAADALGALFEQAGAKRYRDALAGLQDALGEANDAATARRLVKALDAPPAFIRFARERFAHAARGDADEWTRLARRVEAAGPPPLAPAARRLRRA